MIEYTRKCRVCGNPFKTWITHHRYCGGSCARAAEHRHARERYAQTRQNLARLGRVINPHWTPGNYKPTPAPLPGYRPAKPTGAEHSAELKRRRAALKAERQAMASTATALVRDGLPEPWE